MTYLILFLHAFYIFSAKTTKGIKRLSKKERKNIKIDNNTYEALTGMMLRDGHISQRSPKSNARFVFAQSGKPEKREYFNLVLSLMLPFCTIGYVPYSKI